MGDPMEAYFEALENWAEARSEYKAPIVYTHQGDSAVLARKRQRCQAATDTLKQAFTNAVRSVMREGL